MPRDTPSLPLSADALGEWRSRISRAQQARESWKSVEDENLKRYAPQAEDLGTTRARYDINTNVDFRQVEQKKALLLFDVPTVLLTPEEPRATIPNPQHDPANSQSGPSQVSLQDAVTVHQAVLKQILGPKPVGVAAKRMAQQVLVDCLAVAGIGWSKLGYAITTQPVKTELDDPSKPPVGVTLDPGSGMPVPILAKKTVTVDVPIHERYFWERLSYRKGLLPADWDQADPDEAPWIAMRFAMPLLAARAEYDLPETFETTVDKDPYLTEADSRQPSGTKLVTGVEIWYKAHLFDAGQRHPQKVRELVLIDGLEDSPARHRDSPYQTWTTEGRLTPDSLIGYPIHPLTLRDVPDRAIPPSDNSMTRPLVDELNIFRGQLVLQRDASRPVLFFNAAAVPPEFLERAKANDYFTYIPIADDQWPPNTPPFLGAVLPSQPRDNYSAQDYIERDIERTLAIGANQSGVAQSGRRSATEIQTIQGNVDARMSVEQGRVLEWFLRGVAKLDTLVQRYAEDAPTLIEIVGEDGARRWSAWNKDLIAGRYLYTAKPDSQLKVDAASDRAQHLQFYNLTANNPGLNQGENLRELIKKFGYDPAKWIAPPPPPPPPDLPKVSVSIKMEDLLTPAAPVAIELLQGKPVSQAAVQMMLEMKAALPPEPSTEDGDQPRAPEPRGLITPPTQVPPVDAHQGRRTGGLEGVGVM